MGAARSSARPFLPNLDVPNAWGTLNGLEEAPFLSFLLKGLIAEMIGYCQTIEDVRAKGDHAHDDVSL
jgi:hypothetical protein